MTKKFSLPAGTTNRHRWHKEAAHAIGKVAGTFNMLRQIYGQHGGESRESLVTVYGFGSSEQRNPEAVAIYEALGERFGWQITKDNADEVRDAFREALPACMESVPVEDNRTTADEEAERDKLRRKQDAERKAAAAEKAARVDTLAAELRKQYPHAIGPDAGKSGHARAAANLKRILQDMGLQASVKSDSYSMGNSVTAKVLTPDLPPERRKEIDAICQLFTYGTFDPMTDSTGYDHTDEGEAWEQVHGRAKHCRAEYERSDENRAAALAFLGGDDPDHESHQLWSGAHCRAAEFWEQWQAEHKAPEPVTGQTAGAGYSIQKHHHSKRGFDFWLVVLADKVEREQFEALRDSCKAAGGWYSRRWGKTPGGFAFKEQEQAGAWAVQEFSDHDSDPNGSGPAPEPRRNTDKAEKFREMADKLDAEVTAKRGDHQENTPKRQREAMSRRIDADRLERTAQGLRALANLYEAGELPELLAKFTSKKAVYKALGVRTVSNGYYHIAPTDERTDDSPEAAALWGLIDGKDPEQEKADKLAEMMAGLPKIPGYFPTPPDLIEEMLDRAQIRTGHAVLEPSAGDGAILAAIDDLHAEPVITVAYEINPTLCEVLRARGYDARPVDFLKQRGEFRYDRIVMNPPFEKMQDVEHVRHAFELLKPGGRLVAIMSPGPFFRDDRKATQFRDWFDDLGGEAEDIEAGAFKQSGTGVASKLVVIDKPEHVAKPLPEVDTVKPRCHDIAESFRRADDNPEQFALF